MVVNVIYIRYEHGKKKFLKYRNVSSKSIRNLSFNTVKVWAYANVYNSKTKQYIGRIYPNNFSLTDAIH
jgi:hypothetical protein